ncbi:MAG: TetR/AcrR family transcriptional regulator [bacterium]
MPRIRKEHNVRRDELLDLAWELFTEVGYEEASVQEIVDRANIAKGTFYHYFKSKEELLEAVLNRTVEHNLPTLEALVSNSALNAIDKLNRLLAVAAQWRIRNAHLVRNVLARMFSSENLRLRHGMYSKNQEMAAPLLAAILEQGQHEGVFDTDDPEGSAEMMLQLGFQMGELNAAELLAGRTPETTIERMVLRYTRYCRGLERLAGAPRDSIQLPGKRIIEEIVRAGSGYRRPES